jgi:hypothetical protein
MSGVSISGSVTVGDPSSTLAAPVDSPGAGTYSSAQTVTLSLPGGATGCYRKDGTPPTAPTPGTCGSGSTTYSSSFTISTTSTLKALATEAGFTNSAILSSLYTISTPGTITFSPAAGTYTGSQAVTVGCPNGDSCFYTTDGSTPNIASQEVTGPITISATSTLHVIAAQVGTVAQNTGASSTNWKCVTPNAGTSNGITCQAGGGVGTIQPSAWTWTWGTPMVEGISTTSSTGETQMLNIYTGASCDSCTMLAEDKTVQPSQGSTYIANNEMDVSMNDSTDARLHMGGLQCNQQSGTLQWQVNNEQGSWQNTGITFGCPLSTTQPTHVGFTMHWTPGDTGCGGYGCDSYDSLTITVGGVSNTYSLGKTLEAYTEPGWSSYVGNQDQIDLTNTTASGANPTTAARSVWNNNVTAGYYGTTVTGSAAYTISPSASVFSASPTSVSEGSIPTSTTAYYQPVTVTNTGTGNLTFSGISFTGTNASDFKETAGFAPAVNTLAGNTAPQCSTSTPVAPGAKCIVPIDFVPGANGSRSGSLTFTDNAPGSPHTVAITGTGTAASGTVLPACGSMLSANTTYYATGNITCPNTGFGINGTGIVVNLNGYNLTTGNSPTYPGAAQLAFYTAPSFDNLFSGSSCSLSGASYACGHGITATGMGGSATIENGTITLAGGATSAATMQYGDIAIYTGANGGTFIVHDIHFVIPLDCTSCEALSGWAGTSSTANGSGGDRFYANTITDQSGFVDSRCDYEGFPVIYAGGSSGTASNPGGILYENSIIGSPQGGLALASVYMYAFGNTIENGNPTGTSAGSAVTCSGIGTSATGTMAVSGFGIEEANNNIYAFNNTINVKEGRGIDSSTPNVANTTFVNAGNTITAVDFANYVEYQGTTSTGAPGCEVGGGYGGRWNGFGKSGSSGYQSTGNSYTAHGAACPPVAFSISSNANVNNSAANDSYIARLDSGHGNINAIAMAIASQDYTSGNVQMFTVTNGYFSGDTIDADMQWPDSGNAGPWTCNQCTFNKPATATHGFCGNPATPALPSWVVVGACAAGLGPFTLGPLYLVDPVFTGGATASMNDFTTATSDAVSGTTASYYIEFTYTVTVMKASGGVGSGATVTIVDTKSSTECTATTNSSGVATCVLKDNEYSFTAPNAPVTTSFNPMAETVTDSGCTTLNDSFSISSATSRTVTLAGC